MARFADAGLSGVDYLGGGCLPPLAWFVIGTARYVDNHALRCADWRGSVAGFCCYPVAMEKAPRQTKDCERDRIERRAGAGGLVGSAIWRARCPESFPCSVRHERVATAFPIALTGTAVFGAAQDAVRRSALLAGDGSGTAGRTPSSLRTASHHCSADLVTVSAGALDAARKSARRAGGRFGRAVHPFWSPDSVWAARSVFLRHP